MRFAIVGSGGLGCLFGGVLARAGVDVALIGPATLVLPVQNGVEAPQQIAGKRVEFEAINGAVVRMGREFGIPTPLNGLVYGALKPYADGAPALPS